MNDCGHQCCQIAGNAYHTHVEPPATCPHCAAQPDPTAEAEAVAGLGRVVASVVAHIAPEIPGLPTGPALAELVGGHALVICEAALDDPDLQFLDPADRRTVLAGRVALALAFPESGVGRR